MIQAMKNLNLLQKKWYVTDSQTAKDKYKKKNDSIRFETKSIKINVENDANVAFKNCAPFSTCKAEINDVCIDEANNIYIPMPMYNLIKYSDNYSDTSETLWRFERDEVTANNTNLRIDRSQSGKTGNADEGNSIVQNTKIVAPIKHLSNFWKSLEM